MRLQNFISLLAVSSVAASDIIVSYDAEIKRVVTYTGMEARALRPVNCKVINGVLSALKGLGGPATAFCSSYLSIGTATVTNTATPSTSFVTVVSTASTATVTVPAPVKRVVTPGSKPVAVPPVLKNYLAAELTSACKCLNIPSQTAHATVTAATPINTVTQLTTATATVTAAPLPPTCGAQGSFCDCDSSVCCSNGCDCVENFIVINTCL